MRWVEKFFVNRKMADSGNVLIPKEFWSFAEGQPFRVCVVCGENLLADGGRFYMIEKAYRKGEVVFEYAICLSCQQQLEAELSQQSLKLIAHYFDEHVDWAQIRGIRELSSSRKGTALSGLSRCLITGKQASECAEYHILTACFGENLLESPCLIGDEAIESIQQLVSRKTRDQLDGFVEEFLGLPPAVKNPVPCFG